MRAVIQRVSGASVIVNDGDGPVIDKRNLHICAEFPVLNLDLFQAGNHAVLGVGGIQLHAVQ